VEWVNVERARDPMRISNLDVVVTHLCGSRLIVDLLFDKSWSRRALDRADVSCRFSFVLDILE